MRTITPPPAIAARLAARFAGGPSDTAHAADGTALRPSRRAVLAGGAGAIAGLTIGIPAFAATPGPAAGPVAPASPFGGYLNIAPDGTVTVVSSQMDMGQGIYNGIATLVAEEIDADWSRIRVTGGSGNLPLYGNLAWGGVAQGTGGSTGTATSWMRYRTAGATARAMLVTAAAEAWRIPAGEITIANGIMRHPSGRSAGIGEFAEAAARLPVPATVQLKQPDAWRYIGNADQRRFDSRDKATGRQDFTIDVRLPGMLVAVIAHPPRFGAKVRRFDAASAMAVPGVVEVVQVSRGVAVVARDTWAAMRGREALRVDWDDAGAETRGSAALLAAYREQAKAPGERVAIDRGDAAGALAKASRIIEAQYEFPYLAHAALEPLNAVARMENGRLDVWGGHQIPDLYRFIAAQTAGIAPDAVAMHVMKTGGGFGRRAVPDGEIIQEVVEIAKAIGWRAPVKLQWTRENDMRGGRYRPMMVHAVRVGIGADGRIAGWDHRIVGQSILIGTPFEALLVKDGVDATSVEGVADTPYGLTDFRTEVTNMQVGVPTLWWRAVGHTHTAYAMETMIDEIAAATGADPVAFRLSLLADKPRHAAVLRMAAEAAGWGTAATDGRHRGVALHESFGSVVAMVMEITMDGAMPKVHRVVCAVDCGIAVNPDVVRAQIEGGVGFGLGAILREELTLNDGQVEQGNYDAYRPLRIDEMPRVEVHIVPSSNPPTGIGEPGVPAVGPALANAVAAATGRRVRRLPFERTQES